MKRRELIRAIEGLGARLLREGGGHTIYVNGYTGAVIPVPRHPEIKEHTARKILNDAAKR